MDFEEYYKSLQSNKATVDGHHDDSFENYYDQLRMDSGIIPDPKKIPLNPVYNQALETEQSDQAQMAQASRISDDMMRPQRQLDQDLIDRQQMDQASQISATMEPTKKPFLAQIQSDIYDNTIGQVANKFMRAAVSAVDAVSPGDDRARMQQAPDYQRKIFGEALNPPQTTADKVADFAGSMYGATPGILGAYKVGGKLAAKAFGKLPTRITSAIDDLGRVNGIGNAANLAGMAARGAGAGVAYGTAEEALQAAQGEEQSIGGRLGDVATQGALFAAGDAVFGVAGQAVSNGLRNGVDALKASKINRSYENTDLLSRADSNTNRLPQQGSRLDDTQGIVDRVNREEAYNSPEAQANRSDSVLEQYKLTMQSKYDPQNLGKDVWNSMSRSEKKQLAEYQSKVGEVNPSEPLPIQEVQPAPRQPINLQESTTSTTSLQELKNPDELGFAETVRNSDNTPQPLKQAVNDTPMVGARTSDVLNRQQAEKLIEIHGREGLYSKLLSKSMNLSPSESTAAQILAKQFANEGGKENLAKAIELVSKTAKEGREMGQAIQALTQWNKMDETGALLLGERQLNRGVKDTSEWKKLTVEQATPIQEAAQFYGKAEETKNLADEVLSIVTNKQKGEVLTDAEKSTIQQFQAQVKDINEKTKGFLPKAKKAADVTIREVGDIKPKERTRDQVVSYLDAKAEKARQRLDSQRNIGFAAMPNGNPVIDWSIIGASKVAKGVVKLTDFSEQMIKDFGQSVKPHINEVFNRSVRMFRKENGLPTIEELDRVVASAIKKNSLNQEEAHRFKAWANEISYMSDNFKVEATQDLQTALKNLGESTLGDKISTLQTGSMLLNPVTLGRNVIGNAAQLISEKVIKVATVPIDFGLSKLTGEQRTIFFKTMNQEKFWKDFLTGTKAGWKGVSATGTLDSYGIHANVFGNKNPLKYITKSLGASLQGFDYAFYNQAKGEVLATYAENLGKAQGLTKAEIKNGMKELILKLDTRIHELADHAGLYATYQDSTLLSKGSEALKRGLNDLSTGKISRKLVDMGMPKKLSMEGFGLGDVVNKFAKTPANLIMRGLDYSPIGFIRSAVDVGTYIFKREKFSQHEASRTLGRAITGTLGLTGMGFILADAGILTGSSSMDKDVRSIQEQSGQGAYKVNWSALERFFTSSFDYEAAKYKKGDRMMDYAWLQPAAISVAMGVNANKAWKDRKAGVDTEGWQVAGKAILGGLQSFLENPMVQGINNLIDAGTDIIKKQDPTKLLNMGKGVPASFVPTLLNQGRTATDNNQRETFDKNLIIEMGNLMANKVPGLSKKLPISYDSLGKPRERIQGGTEGSVSQYLTAFFSPAKMTEYSVSPEAKLVLDLMNQSGDATILPRISDRFFKVEQGKNQKDKRVDLNAEQFSRLQQKVGTLVESKLAEKSKYLSDPNVSLKNKVERIKTILTEAGKKARDEIGTPMGYKKKNIR